MRRPSKLLEELEDKLVQKCGPWFDRHKKKFPVYIPLGLTAWYFYGMFLNSLKLGTALTFCPPGETPPESIWVLNPFKNWFVLLTPFGLGVTAVVVLLICLITKKGYIWFSGYKYTHDSRGFDILPDATHGSSGFLTKKEMAEFLELGPAREVKGMMLGKIKARPEDPDKYAAYAAHRMVPGDNNNLLCIGAPGSGKSRGFIIPFMLGCAQRGESIFITDPKAELFEKMSPYFKEHGYCVRAVNFLDMAHSDGWNCLYSLDKETQLVQTVANTIIQNTSGAKEADDFWSRAELNLLMALIHYVCNLKDDQGNLLPIEQRGLGDVYQLLANKSINEINRILAALPPEHPAKGHHGLFLKARENLWGNIAIGLGNRLAIFQNKLVDAITRNHDVDLLLPGQKPCAYFVIISAQDSAYRFLSSLFFSLALPRLSDYARLHGKNGRLPVLVNFCLDEYCNIGYMEGIADALNSIRGFNMSCQVVVQSLSQWQEKYHGKEWENQLATFDQTLYMGCNDLTSAEYISKKCGKVTISVTNNQMPLMPLFSPVYTSTRPYSQTRSNTQRDLMLPDEILRLDRRQCIALFQGRKPALLYKLAPEELPNYNTLKSCKVIDYTPEWKRREEEKAKPAPAPAPPPEAPPEPSPAPGVQEKKLPAQKTPPQSAPQPKTVLPGRWSSRSGGRAGSGSAKRCRPPWRPGSYPHTWGPRTASGASAYGKYSVRPSAASAGRWDALSSPQPSWDHLLIKMDVLSRQALSSRREIVFIIVAVTNSLGLHHAKTAAGVRFHVQAVIHGTMYCAIVIPYRVRVVIPATEMWEAGHERPDFVLQNMVGATIDFIIIKVDRESGFAIGSRRLAARSQRYFFAHRPALCREGARLKCRLLSVGPRRCLVECYGHDINMTQRDLRYTAIPDLRNEYRPGQELDCVVKGYDPEKEALRISVKETESNPFEGAEFRHPAGSRRQAVIAGKYGGGVFCNLPDGTVCMCNYSYQYEDSDFLVGDTVILLVQRHEREKRQMYGKILSKW